MEATKVADPSERGMNKSKQANASEREDGVDMISNLPDPILQMILSRIPTTEEVARTSILSTRWRYLWTSVPSIDIDCWRGLNWWNFNTNKFKKFVSHVLASNSLDLDSFRLCCSDLYSMSTVYQWIQAAVTRNIKQLNLLFCHRSWSKSIELPYFLVTCDSLEVLRLNLYDRRLVLPTNAGFPSLRVLELNNVLLYKVNNFLESCPLLEDLSLVDCATFRLKVLCISCPKLKSLRLDFRDISVIEDMLDIDTQLCGCIKIVCPKLEYLEFGAFKARSLIIKSLDSLKKAVIHPGEFPSEFVDYMFKRILNIESLSTSIDLFCFGLWPSVEPPFVPNIKTLELITRIHTHTPIVSDLIKFLACLPHLESLYLIIDEEYFDWDDWKLDEAETRSILTCHLKRVKFLNFNKKKQILDVARSLLEHGNVLEEMVFRWRCDEAEFNERSMETMKEVSKFQKASSTVRLITLNKISYYQLSGKP